IRAQRLDERQIGQRERALLVAMPDERRAAVQRGVGGELLADARLADAWLTHHHPQVALAGGRCVKRIGEVLQLLLSADEGAAVERTLRPLIPTTSGRPLTPTAWGRPLTP